MSKAKYWILNLVGGACALLWLASLVLGRINERNGQALTDKQTELNRAQQVQNTIQNLVVRIAQAGQTEPALRDLLTRQDLKVNLNDGAPAKPAP
jgi:hypothetical protein